MKLSLLKILYCPKCQSHLELKDHEDRNGEVFRGTLACPGCSSKFDITNYIPRFVKQENYSSSWEKLWKETDAFIRDSSTGLPTYEDTIHGKYSEEGRGEKGKSPFAFEWPRNLKGQLVLEVGPGTGVCTEHLIKTGAEIIAVDMSGAIDVFPEKLLTAHNVNVIQADINTKIFKENTFDRIWLFQVLQHTPSPAATLVTMRKLLKTAGAISFTSYSGRYNPWYYGVTKRLNRDFMWRFINYSTPIMVPLKYRLQKAFLKAKVPIASKIVKKVLEPFDPRNIYFSVMEGKAADYAYGQLWQTTQDKDLLFRHIAINTFDCITPDYTNCANHDEIEEWCRQAGFAKVKTWGRAGVRAVAVK